MNLFVCITLHYSFAQSRSDIEISADLSSTASSVWFNPKKAATTHAKFRYLVLTNYTNIKL
jgi:hypothetical protein